MPLTPAQKQQFFQIRRTKGPEAAATFRASVEGGAPAQPATQPAAQPTGNLGIVQPSPAAQPAQPATTPAPLTPAQKQQFFQIRREQGPEAAAAFRGSVTGGAPATTPAVEQLPAATAETATPAVEQLPAGTTTPAATTTPAVEQLPAGTTTPADTTTLSGATTPAGAQPNQQQIAQPQFGEEYQQRLFNDAVNTFDAQNQKYFDLARQQLEQQMANEGVPIGSEQYNRRMQLLTETQAQQKQQAVSAAYANSFQAATNLYNTQANLYGTQMQTEAQRYNTDVSAETSRYGTDVSSETSRYIANQSDAFNRDKMEYDRQMNEINNAFQLELSKGQNASQEKIAQLKVDAEKLNQKRLLRAQDRWKKLESETSRMTAGAGTLSLADRLALIDAEEQSAINVYYAQQAVNQVDEAFGS